MTPNYYYAEQLWQLRQAKVEKVSRNAWMYQSIPKQQQKHSGNHPLLSLSRIPSRQGS